MSGENADGESLSRFAPLGVAIVWGVNVPVMKAALAELDPFLFNFLRLSLSAVVLGAAVRIERRRQRHAAPPGPTPWLWVLCVGLLSGLLYQVLFLSGIDRTSAGHTALLIASSPLWTAVVASAVGQERYPARTWGGLAIAFAGTAIVVSTGARTAGATLAGNLLVLAASLAWALATVWSRPLLTRVSPTRLAFLGTAVSLPGHAWLSRAHFDVVRTLDAATWTAILYSGALSTGVAYVWWNHGVRRIGSARTAIYTNLVPVVALFCAWVGLGEVPQALQLGGGALVLAGVALSRARRTGVVFGRGS